MRFRTKSAEVEAMYWDGSAESAKQIKEWVGDVCGWAIQDRPAGSTPSGRMWITTTEGTALAAPGDWIIQGDDGAFRICQAETFYSNYEQIADS